MIKRKTFSVALRCSGGPGGIAHLVAHIFGDPRILRPASSIEFRHIGLGLGDGVVIEGVAARVLTK
jgi:hypothetical protein